MSSNAGRESRQQQTITGPKPSSASKHVTAILGDGATATSIRMLLNSGSNLSPSSASQGNYFEPGRDRVKLDKTRPEYDVFVSHASEIKKGVSLLVDYLENWGLRVR